MTVPYLPSGNAIVTVTFSPCIDKSIVVEQLIPDIKLRCEAPLLQPGGGGINVARAIKKLGGTATAIYPSGGYTGHYFNQLLVEENVPSIIIETANETRENIMLMENCSRKQFRLGMPGAKLFEKEWIKILESIEAIDQAAFLVVSGSIPPGVPDDIIAKIAGIAGAKKIKLVVDSSGPALKKAAGEGVFLLKPNLRELCSLADLPQLATDEIIPVAKKLIAGGACEIMVVSLGAGGAILVTEKMASRILPPQVKVKSTVGAGDSMVAGIIFALSNEEDIEAAVQYGVACGTAATLAPGTELCNKKDADHLFMEIMLTAKEQAASLDDNHGTS